MPARGWRGPAPGRRRAGRPQGRAADSGGVRRRRAAVGGVVRPSLRRPLRRAWKSVCVRLGVDGERTARIRKRASGVSARRRVHWGPSVFSGRLHSFFFLARACGVCLSSHPSPARERPLAGADRRIPARSPAHAAINGLPIRRGAVRLNGRHNLCRPPSSTLRLHGRHPGPSPGQAPRRRRWRWWWRWRQHADGRPPARRSPGLFGRRFARDAVHLLGLLLCLWRRRRRRRRRRGPEPAASWRAARLVDPS